MILTIGGPENVTKPDKQEQHRLANALQTALDDAIAIQRAGSESSRVEPPKKSLSFAPQLVNAILAGRKTQTRRLIRPQPKRKPSISTCPIAQPGDRLYVREPWASVDGRIVYAADAPFGVPAFKPAMFMPRDASRLILEVTRVSAERLTAITPVDAIAEGCPAAHRGPVQWFAGLWNGFFTNPTERWEDDPWVWVIHFKISR